MHAAACTTFLEPLELERTRINLRFPTRNVRQCAVHLSMEILVNQSDVFNSTEVFSGKINRLDYSFVFLASCIKAKRLAATVLNTFRERIGKLVGRCFEGIKGLFSFGSIEEFRLFVEVEPFLDRSRSPRPVSSAKENVNRVVASFGDDAH